ncbi:hypothetical protein O3P69_018206 [Scylla paramamosain]|uniref:FLYWCH-type domain-containing protein n=1 Tax=Scylla paramamosain TaxID=85552 RepID=A0AAW0TLH6_SCYPA
MTLSVNGKKLERLSWCSPLVRCSPSASALHKTHSASRPNPSGQAGTYSGSGDLASPLPCPQCGREFHGLNKKFLLTRHMQNGAFVKSQRGKDLLYFEGYKHRICRVETGGRSSWWRCTKKTCRGRVRLTVEGITLVEQHNHSPLTSVDSYSSMLL